MGLDKRAYVDLGLLLLLSLVGGLECALLVIFSIERRRL